MFLYPKAWARVGIRSPIRHIKDDYDLGSFRVYLESQVGQNNRPLYPQVAHCGDKVASNYGLFGLYLDAPLT